MLHIENVEWVGGYLLSLRFDDGMSKVVDVLPLLRGTMFEPLREIAMFSAVSIDPVSRTVVWPNGADLAPEALYTLSAVVTSDSPNNAVNRSRR